MIPSSNKIVFIARSTFADKDYYLALNVYFYFFIKRSKIRFVAKSTIGDEKMFVAKNTFSNENSKFNVKDVM